MERVLNNTELANPRPRKKKRWIKSATIFVIVMLLYPVAHFLIMWIAVNFNSILLCFQRMNGMTGEVTWVGFKDLFYNFETMFMEFKTDSIQNMFIASAAYPVISCFITLPIALFFSYFIFKKIVANGFFKVIFFLPSIIPLVVLTLAYRLTLSTNGPLGQLMINMGASVDFVAGLFNGWPSASIMVWIFCIWAGIGYDVILLTAGMARIPRDILESCKMDGVPSFKEFIRIVVPLTWPTITTLFILGLMSMFNVYLQPFFLVGGVVPTTRTVTLGLKIYTEANNSKQIIATYGIFCSIIGAPIIMTIRHFLNKMFAEVNF